ncbi:hypothetical protein GGR53DRAFT_528325 [Hypoxylon sp. FL1150]|nr:hypothetical protein GGR53DRAFT_528325 [Hypoxylon sp. FL1150]
MNSHKERRSGTNLAVVAKEPEREFENIHLLQDLMGGSKKQTLGRHAAPNRHSSCPSNSSGEIPPSNTCSHQPKSSVASLRSTTSLTSDHRESARQLPSISTAPQPSRTSSCLQWNADSSPRSYKSPVVPRSSSLTTPDTPTSSQIQRPSTQPTSKPDPGLSALFQQPVRLKSYSASTGSGTRSSTRSSQDSLFTTSSMTSLHSTVSGWSAYSEPGRPDSQTSQHSTRPVLALSSSNSGVKAEQDRRGKTSRNSPAAEPRDQRIALSHIYAYHARMSDGPARAMESVLGDTRADEDLSSFEGATPLAPQLKGTGEETTEPQSPSSDTNNPDSLESTDSVPTTQSPDSGLMVVTAEIENRRYVADSQAWQRRTRMLQVDYSKDLR